MSLLTHGPDDNELINVLNHPHQDSQPTLHPRWDQSWGALPSSRWRWCSYGEGARLDRGIPQGASAEKDEEWRVQRKRNLVL